MRGFYFASNVTIALHILPVAFSVWSPLKHSPLRSKLLPSINRELSSSLLLPSVTC